MSLNDAFNTVGNRRVNLSDLQHPVVVDALDGCVHFAKSEEDLQKWSATGIKKYNRIRFTVFDRDSNAWELVEIVPHQPITFLNGIFGPRIRRVTVNVEPKVEDGLQLFRNLMLEAVAIDDDILTQNHTADEIRKVVEEAHSFPELLGKLKKMRVIV